MRWFAVASAPILIVSGLAILAQPAGYVEVNGKDSPSNISEWFASESVFRTISLPKRIQEFPPLHDTEPTIASGGTS